MVSICHYESPLGGVLLAADEVGLTGLWFDGEKYFADTLDPEHKAQETPILREAKRWLDVYFRGQEPDFTPPLHPIGSPFRQEVWALLLQIPYGQTTTYGALAKQLVFPRNRSGCCFIPILSAVRRWGRRLRNIRFFPMSPTKPCICRRKNV